MPEPVVCTDIEGVLVLQHVKILTAGNKLPAEVRHGLEQAFTA